VWKHKRDLKPSRAAINTPGDRQRIDSASRFYPRAHPRRIGHIVFFTPDMKASEDFYRKRLGFALSDRYAGGAGVFLRYAAESDHHNLFFINRPAGKPELQHVAFELRDIHEMFGGGMYFDRCGWQVEVGPGRHPISSAYFWYFRNPCGGAVEYFCDSDYVTADWKPHAYRINRFSEWHMAEGIRIADDGKKKQRPAMAAT
jgi:catechol 2,3-dioxygenase-like lactoylglutathione lyase family enzyme